MSTSKKRLLSEDEEESPEEEGTQEEVDMQETQDMQQPEEESSQPAKPEEKQKENCDLQKWQFPESDPCEVCKSKLGAWPHACPGAAAPGDILSECPGCGAQVPRKPGQGGHGLAGGGL